MLRIGKRMFYLFYKVLSFLYRVFFSCLTDKRRPKVPPDALPELRHKPRVEKV
jgi:hypothetical protein